MKLSKLMVSFLLVMVSACSLIETSDNQAIKQQTSLAEGEAVYWINSLRADCVGIAPMSCLQVQEVNQDRSALKQGDWQLFYSSIDGFDYEAGYLYKLLLKKQTLSAEQVPADASSNKYSLVKILEKTVDAKLRLNDIWALESIQGKKLELVDGIKRPQLEIQLRDMRLMGNDGCNGLFGSINYLDDNKITFGPIAGTRMFCHPMDISDRFNQQLNNVTGYTLKALKLRLLDSAGEELLLFRKVD
jgi:heat shock protein HslJ